MHTEEYDENYEEERPIEQRAILDEEDRLLHHSSWKKKSPSIDRNTSTSIDTQLHQPNHLPASTDIPYYPSIDTNVDATRDGNYSIGSWADVRHDESYAVETSYRDQGADELHEGFTYVELLNIAIPPSIDINPSTSIDINHTALIDSRPKPKTTIRNKVKSDNPYLTPNEFGIFRDPDGYAKAIDERTLQVSREDIADILQTANGVDNLFMQQHTIDILHISIVLSIHPCIGVPHGVLGDIWVHLELKRGDKGDHWTSSALERPHRSDTVKSL
ncbi:hypothetical protein F2Q69_00037568 [Brassica cretica]|uniref:Uncharacterized protein n=1 Tax=Brassica cretica TaxID=69181 RepID=A0A8S9SAG7_BRACR|nr:hypothetical protein F2Q69_00037568 [Brassica cretica]